MLSKFSTRVIALLSLLTICFMGASSAHASPIPKPCSDDTISSWFPHKNTPEPDNKNFSSKFICEFNAWSWQMFLWLTQDEGEKPRFLGFETPYDILGIANREVLKPVAGGQKAFDEIVQAGSDGILVDPNGNAVYYSQYVNDVFVKFIKKNELTNPGKVQEFNAETPFDIGTVELKASWKIVEEGEDISRFFTMNAAVYGLKKSGSRIVVDVNNIRQVKLAMVGFHIGGVVKGHPEMIWATFEHIENSPVVPANSQPDTVIASAGHYTFFNTAPGTSIPPITNRYSSCNENYIRSPYMKLDVTTQKLSPVNQACLQYEYGNSANYNLTDNEELNLSIQSTVDKNTESIKRLNKIVVSKLQEEKSVWANYREVGAIWFRPTDALKPNMSLATDLDENGKQFLIGSLKLSNSTIETYTQVASTANNCFRCHNTEQRLINANDGSPLSPLKPMNLNISHAFVNIYTWSQQMRKSEK